VTTTTAATTTMIVWPPPLRPPPLRPPPRRSCGYHTMILWPPPRPTQGTTATSRPLGARPSRLCWFPLHPRPYLASI